MDWLSVFKHLLPNARAWRVVVDKQLRQFFEALGEALGTTTRTFFDSIFDDIDPQKTRELDGWETQFALPAVAGLSEQERRDRLDGTWKALGGQDPRYIEDTLQAAGFDVYVHEWWVPSVAHPAGGSVNGDEVPTLRNPNTYLDDGGPTAYTMTDGGETAEDGDPDAEDGAAASPTGYPLVNKIFAAFAGTTQDGGLDMQDGGVTAQDSATVGQSRKQYAIPSDPEVWPYFLYIGGATFPAAAMVPTSRRDEFENLCLKICPTEQWLGILVTYT